jgi:ABC-type glycerol-3-phosphate transport system substrate-binding protein
MPPAANHREASMLRRTLLACASGAALLAIAPVAEAQGIKAVRYLNQETEPAVVAIHREWIEGFLAANPGTDIILEAAPAQVINQRIATYVQAGAPLDVIQADGGSAARLASAGLLAPLDDVVEALGGRDAFLPGRLLIVDDVVYSINQTPASPHFHYRKDVFEEHGLEPPTTWDELLHAARTIHSDEMAGIAVPGGENRATTIFSGVFLWQNCADFFDSDLNLTIDNERTHEAIQFYVDLLENAPPDVAAWAFAEPIESFWSGRAAMVYYWHGLDLTFRQNPALAEQVGIVPAPEGRMRVTEQGGRYISVFAEAPHVDVAKDWVEYIFTPENGVRFTENSPMLAPPTTHAELELLRHSQAPAIQAYGEILFDVVYPSADYAYNQILNGGGINRETCEVDATGVVNPYVSVLWNSNLYARAIQRVAFDGWSPEEAAAEAQKALEEQIAVAREEMGG